MSTSVVFFADGPMEGKTLAVPGARPYPYFRIEVLKGTTQLPDAKSFMIPSSRRVATEILIYELGLGVVEDTPAWVYRMQQKEGTDA